MPNQIETAPDSDLESAHKITKFKDAEGSGKCTTYVTLIYIVGIIGIVGSTAKMVLIAIDIDPLYDVYPLRSTSFLCGLGIAMSGFGLLWEVSLLYFVLKRKLFGMQHYMVASMLFFMQACIFGVVTGGVYKDTGLYLSMSFMFDVIRTPIQMLLVHKFIKSEKLNEDAHYIAASYKKF